MRTITARPAGRWAELNGSGLLACRCRPQTTVGYDQFVCETEAGCGTNSVLASGSRCALRQSAHPPRINTAYTSQNRKKYPHRLGTLVRCEVAPVKRGLIALRLPCRPRGATNNASRALRGRGDCHHHHAMPNGRSRLTRTHPPTVYRASHIGGPVIVLTCIIVQAGESLRCRLTGKFFDQTRIPSLS